MKKYINDNHFHGLYSIIAFILFCIFSDANNLPTVFIDNSFTLRNKDDLSSFGDELEIIGIKEKKINVTTPRTTLSCC